MLAQGALAAQDQEPPRTWIIAAPTASTWFRNVTITWEGFDDATPTHELIYYYRLAGYDNAWRLTSNTSASYTSLADGNYTFTVYAVDQSGKASDKTPAQASFTVASAPVAMITEVTYSTDVILGQPATITVKVKNQGDEAKWQTIAVSFPQGVGANDIILGYSVGNAKMYNVGEEIGAGYGSKRIQLEYPVVEGTSTPWATVAEKYLQLQVKTRTMGQLEFYVKSVAGRQPDGLVTSWDPASGTKDQQDEYVKSYTINVKDQAGGETNTRPINSLDFGNVVVGDQEDKTTTIYNDSLVPVTVAGIARTSGSADFSYAGPDTFTVGPGDSKELSIRFSPTTEGPRSSSFIVSANGTEVSFAVSGNGLRANQPPRQPSWVSPVDGTGSVAVTTMLNWIGGDPDASDMVSYDVYVGTTSPPSFKETIGPFAATRDSVTYNLSNLVYETQS